MIATQQKYAWAVAAALRGLERPLEEIAAFEEKSRALTRESRSLGENITNVEKLVEHLNGFKIGTEKKYMWAVVAALKGLDTPADTLLPFEAGESNEEIVIVLTGVEKGASYYGKRTRTMASIIPTTRRGSTITSTHQAAF